MSPMTWMVSAYWLAIALATALAGAALLYQALRPLPFGRTGLGVHEAHSKLVGGVGFLHRWSYIDRLCLAGWAFILLSLARLALQAIAHAIPL